MCFFNLQVVYLSYTVRISITQAAFLDDVRIQQLDYPLVVGCSKAIGS